MNLSIAVIVRDEQASLPDMLASIKPLLDAGSELVVVDTGSTDDTVAIARAAGATVHQFLWCDDFAAARNFALDQCRKSWVLSLDADERLNDGSTDAILEAVAGGARFYDIAIHNVVGQAGDTKHHGRRLFPRIGVHWRGRIHETPVENNIAPLAGGVLAGVSITHVGYTPEAMADKGKADRNLHLLLAAVADSPTDPLLRLYLCESLIAASRWLDAADQARACIWLSLAFTSPDAQRLAEQAMVHLVDVVGSQMDGVAALREAQICQKQHTIAHPGFWYVVGCIQMRLGMENDASPTLYAALGSFNRSVALSGQPTFQEDAGVTSWKPWRGMAACYLALGTRPIAELYEARALKLGAPPDPYINARRKDAKEEAAQDLATIFQNLPQG